MTFLTFSNFNFFAVFHKGPTVFHTKCILFFTAHQSWPLLIPASPLPPQVIQVGLKISSRPMGMFLYLCIYTAHTVTSRWEGICKCLLRQWKDIFAMLMLASCLGLSVRSAFKHSYLFKFCPSFALLSLCSFLHAIIFYWLLVTGQVRQVV